MSSALLPLLIMALLLWALYKRVPVFSAFLEGAAKSLPLLGRILPSMAAMLTAISLIRSCGALDAFCTWVAPLCGKLGLDSRLLPLLLLRPLSGSAAAGMTAELYEAFGPDSLVGHLAGVLMGSTETIFYTLGLYFGAAGIRRSRYTLSAALLCTLIAALSGLFFGTLLY